MIRDLVLLSPSPTTSVSPCLTPISTPLLPLAATKQNKTGNRKTTNEKKVVVGEDLSVLDAPGLPDPHPRNSDTYYNDTVQKLRSVGYANAILFVVVQVSLTGVRGCYSGHK